jgi:ribosomal protein L11 methyltransferase
VEVASPGDAELASLWIDVLASLSGRGIEERDGMLVAYFVADDAAEVLAQVQSRLADEGGLGGTRGEAQLTHRFQPHEDWAEIWRRGLAPRRIGGRIVVSPTWESPPLGPGDVLVSVDPGMAFGTAEHPTTRGCLRALEGLVREGARVADVGTGSGILAITAALLGARTVVALESDPWATAAARENARTNSVEDRVDVRDALVGAGDLRALGPFDGIVSNIEAGVLVPLLPEFHLALAPDGWLVLSGILAVEAAGVVQAAVDHGLSLTRGEDDAEWWTGVFAVAEGDSAA